jgi:hypothetical protein
MDCEGHECPTALLGRSDLGPQVSSSRFDTQRIRRSWEQYGAVCTQKSDPKRGVISGTARGRSRGVPPKLMCRQNLRRAPVPRPFILRASSGRSSPLHSSTRLTASRIGASDFFIFIPLVRNLTAHRLATARADQVRYRDRVPRGSMRDSVLFRHTLRKEEIGTAQACS